MFSRLTVLLLAFLVWGVTSLSAQTITTVAGNGTGGFSGDGGPATSAAMHSPSGLAIDSQGNIYFADRQNNRIRKIATDGTISTFAGGGSASQAQQYGDGGQATDASILLPFEIAFNSAGELYISDRSHGTIRKVATDGVITSVAGIYGQFGYSGDGGPATSAEIHFPEGITIDGDGNLIISDLSNHRIRKVDGNGIINTIAGTGSVGGNGDGGQATAAQLHFPIGVKVDQNGVIFITDSRNHRIRTIGTDGIIRTVAGTGSNGFSGDGNAATLAQLSNPRDIAVARDGTLYIADAGNYRIRAVDPNGGISTIAGDGTDAFSGDNGLAVNAQISDVYSLELDAEGDLYIADEGNDRVRKIDFARPDLRVRIDNNYIDSGHQIDFGDVDIDAHNQVTVHLENNGDETLTISSNGNHPLLLSGGSPDMFRLHQGTLSTVIAPGGSTSFQVDFRPTDHSEHHAHVTIHSDDYSHPSFRLNLRGHGRRITPTLTFNNINKTFGDSHFNLHSTTNSDSPVTYSIHGGNTNAISLSHSHNQRVDIHGAGTVTIRASVAQTDTYHAHHTDAVLHIDKATQTISNVANLTLTYSTTPTRLTGTSSSGHQVHYGVVGGGSHSVTVGGEFLHTQHVGTTTVRAAVPESANFHGTHQDFQVTVHRANATIQNFANFEVTYGDSGHNLTATSNSDSPVTYHIIGGADVIALNHHTVHAQKAGTAHLLARVHQTNRYNHHEQVVTVTSHRASATIHNFPDVTLTYGGPAHTLNANTNSDAPIVYEILEGGDVISLANNQITALKDGVARIRASVAQTDRYTHRAHTSTVTVNGATATISGPAGLDFTYGDPDYFLPYTSNSDTPVQYQLTDGYTGVELDGETLEILRYGNATLRVFTPATDRYQASELLVPISVQRAQATILNWTDKPHLVYDDTPLPLDAGSNSDTGVKYTIISGEDIISLGNPSFTMLKAGQAEVRAFVPQTDRYTSAGLTVTFTVAKAPTVFGNWDNFDLTYDNQPHILSPQSNSDATPDFSVTDGDQIVQITGDALTTVKAGQAMVRALYPETDRYLAMDSTVTVTVNKAPASIFSWENRLLTYTPESIQLTAGTTSNEQVQYEVHQGFNVLSVNGDILNTLEAGSARVRAFVPPNDRYLGAERIATIVVEKAVPEINDFSDIILTYGDTDQTINPTTNSNGALSLELADGSDVINLNNNTIVTLKAGQATLRAYTLETEQYKEYEKTITVTVNRATPNITNWNNVALVYSPQPVELDGMSDSDASPEYEIIAGQEFADLEGDKLTPLKAGAVTVRLSLAETDRYAAIDSDVVYDIRKSPAQITGANDVTLPYGKDMVGLNLNTDSDASFVFSIDGNDDVIRILDHSIELLNTGTVNVTASLAETDKYLAASATFTVTVIKATADFGNFGDRTIIFGDPMFSIALQTDYDGAIDYQLVSGESVTLQGSTVMALTSGQSVIRASGQGTRNYEPFSKTATITVERADPSIMDFNDQTRSLNDGGFTLMAHSNSDGAITYEIVSGDGNGSLEGNQVTVTGTGVFYIKASVAETGRFNSGFKIAGFTIMPELLTVGNVEPALSVFPVPSSDGYVNVSARNNIEMLRVVDLGGRVVYEAVYAQHQKKEAELELRKGVYTLLVWTKDGRNARKVIVK
ncbi:hypothetical protein FUAX_38510 (plasmid) [Fulvitalea axinellae]|uniref:Por secretion system C-terminal sorting domain-containing protein n=1 Tax=Fulvitalea axinellae TaxID=1182444 RepID=A0AAU9DA03_9BACT|nr:hypothetical protein FUAX_38510 [Fulvitalea axinellae]